ncbi:MAG TPA: hypothetical protein DCD97_01520 [Firmicutes bacterium]|nr:hypothetical protein [Bacillota bacterium]
MLLALDILFLWLLPARRIGQCWRATRALDGFCRESWGENHLRFLLYFPGRTKRYTLAQSPIYLRNKVNMAG